MINELAVYIALLLTASTLLSLWERYQPRTKKNYFKNRLKGVEKEIWDREFLRYKTREIREELRQEYDKVRAKQDELKREIANRLELTPALTDEQRKDYLDRVDLPLKEEQTKTLRARLEIVKAEMRNGTNNTALLEEEKNIRDLLFGNIKPLTEEEKKKLNVDDERRRLEDQAEILDRDIKRKLEGDDRPEMQHIPSLKSLDGDIEVMNATIEGLHELKVMTKDWIKRI